MAFTSSDGIQIAYEDISRYEPTLLFLPGWCEPRTVFQHVSPQCATSHRVTELDWRGHGASGPARGDFGNQELVKDALAVIEATRPEEIVPVCISHAGWVAIELQRRLGEKVRKIVLLDWIVLDPPPPFAAALQGLQRPGSLEKTRDEMFAAWIDGCDNREVVDHVRSEMGAFPAEMWSRAAREISAAYAAYGNPLAALSALQPHIPVLHLYAQPRDEGYLQAQEAFARQNPWFHVRRVEARSHFPSLENPDEVSAAILEFVGRD